MRTVLAIASVLGLNFALLPSATQAATDETERPWSVSVYAAQWSDNRYNEIIRGQTRMRNSYLYAVALGYEFARPRENLGLEGEIQFVRHSGKQNHSEFNAMLLARWHKFPWDHIVDTTVAHGFGPSYATQVPKVEDNAPRRPGSRSLLYMMTEATFAHPERPEWQTFVRIHHRSCVFDLLSEAEGSNFIGAGIRYRF